MADHVELIGDKLSCEHVELLLPVLWPANFYPS